MLNAERNILNDHTLCVILRPTWNVNNPSSYCLSLLVYTPLPLHLTLYTLHQRLVNRDQSLSDLLVAEAHL